MEDFVARGKKPKDKAGVMDSLSLQTIGKRTNVDADSYGNMHSITYNQDMVNPTILAGWTKLRDFYRKSSSDHDPFWTQRRTFMALGGRDYVNFLAPFSLLDHFSPLLPPNTLSHSHPHFLQTLTSLFCSVVATKLLSFEFPGFNLSLLYILCFISQLPRLR
ncbi:hypothetical protein JHK85_028327 [Glycine max]|nr:hypothetical protein JHK85_028327 [Glycine max]